MKRGYTYGTVHELKTWTNFFNDLVNGSKTFEVRKYDRPFKKGDILLLKEYNPNSEQYTGVVCSRKITYVLEGGQFGIEKGYCVLGLEKL